MCTRLSAQRSTEREGFASCRRGYTGNHPKKEKGVT